MVSSRDVHSLMANLLLIEKQFERGNGGSNNIELS